MTTGIKLDKFDKKFLEIIKDYKKIHLKPDEGIHYTIICAGRKAGVIGYKVKESGKNFLKIGIHQDFRGQGIFEKALKLLVKEHGIRKIYSTIAQANIASIKAHKKIGFRMIPKWKEVCLREEGLLHKRNMRLVKIFK